MPKENIANFLAGPDNE